MNDLEKFKKLLCSCGETHRMLTKEVIIGEAVFNRVGSIIKQNGLPEDVLVVYDQNTMLATSGRISASLRDSGIKMSEYIYQSGVHADGKGVGLLMFAAADHPKMLVGVGSGTICDLCRFCAHQMGIPFIICATAPSMNGYASAVAAMTAAGIKTSFPATFPQLILGETEVLKNAPLDMIAAGFGDIAGKLSSLMDWEMGQIVLGERHCQEISDLTYEAVDVCFSAGMDLGGRGDIAVENLMQALTISGIAMQLNGNSRPASGSEHHISHFLEMMDSKTDRAGAYHGAKVGIASQITLRLYEKLFLDGLLALKEKSSEQAVIEGIRAAYGNLADGLLRNSPAIYMDAQAMHTAIKENFSAIQARVGGFAQARATIKEVLLACHGPVNPQDLEYPRELMRDAIVYSRFLRGRFTILTMLANWGLLEQYAEEVLDEIY